MPNARTGAGVMDYDRRLQETRRPKERFGIMGHTVTLSDSVFYSSHDPESVIRSVVERLKADGSRVAVYRGWRPDGTPTVRLSISDPRKELRPKCGAKTRRGTPCQARCVPGKGKCRMHGGLSTGPKTQEGRARIAAANRRRWEAYRAAKALQQPAARERLKISSHPALPA